MSDDHPVTAAPARVPVWRMAVIAFVGLLAVAIGLVAAAFLMGPRAPGVGPAAEYVPSDAVMYVEIRLEPSTGQDAALRELIGRFPAIEGLDPDRPLFDQLTEKVDEALAAEGEDFSWEADVAPWFDGRIAFALLDYPSMATAVPIDPLAPMDPMTPMELPGFVVMVGVTDPAAAADAAERLRAEAERSGTRFTSTEHAGTTIWSVPDAATPDAPGAYALTDDQLLLAPTADDIVTALDTRAAGTADLADGEVTQRLAAALPDDWLMFAVVNFEAVVEQALADLGDQAPEMRPFFESLLEHQSLRSAMAVSASGDRLQLDSAMTPPTGPFAVENADRGLADEVPPDALYFADGGNIGPAWASLIEGLKASLAEMPDLGEGIGQVEATLGSDLEELVAWIDDGAVAVGWDGEQPYGGMVLVPSDVDEATRRLGQVAAFARLAMLDPSSGVTVDDAEVAGTTVTTISWLDPGGPQEQLLPAPTSVVVEYGITEDRVVIGVGDRFVRRVLELDPADSLGSEDRYADAVAELGGASNAGVAYLDLAGIREAVEEALLPMLDATGDGEMYRSEVQPWLLPLDRMVSVSRLENDLLVQRATLIVD